MRLWYHEVCTWKNSYFFLFIYGESIPLVIIWWVYHMHDSHMAQVNQVRWIEPKYLKKQTQHKSCTNCSRPWWATKEQIGMEVFFLQFMPVQISNAINGMKCRLKLSNSSLDRASFKIAFEIFLNFKILNYF